MNRRERRSKQRKLRKKQGRIRGHMTKVGVPRTKECVPTSFAERLQVELHHAIRRATSKGEKADVVQTVQGLGYFAAVAACEAGYSEMDWRRAMSHYMSEVRRSLGMEYLTDVSSVPVEPEPSIIVSGR